MCLKNYYTILTLISYIIIFISQVHHIPIDAMNRSYKFISSLFFIYHFILAKTRSIHVCESTIKYLMKPMQTRLLKYIRSLKYVYTLEEKMESF